MPRRSRDLAELEDRIGYRFKDRTLLLTALTHVSAGADKAHYQRLEFLGDRVLGLAIADMLYTAFPEASEGDLSRRLSELVRKETCAEVALAWDLGPFLHLGGGGQMNMRRNPSVLGDACESVIGAVYRAGGYEAARALVERGFSERLRALADPPSNPKAVLQEWALGRGLATPVYDIAERSGPDHLPQFRISVRVEGVEPAIGLGRSKRAAEQEAARHLLLREGIWSDHDDRLAV